MPERRAFITLMEFQVVKYEIPLQEGELLQDAFERVKEANAHERWYDLDHEVLNDGDILVDFEEVES